MFSPGSKAARLLSLLVRDPAEFMDRSMMIVGSRLSSRRNGKPQYKTTDWSAAAVHLATVLGRGFEAAMEEPELLDLDSQLRQKLQRLPSDAPFEVFHNGDSVLARLCYAAVRAIRPETVLETGVCYGVTSAHLLLALELNRRGHLHSIDLPPLGKNNHDYVGWLIPSELRHRWTLRRGTAQKLLAPTINGLGPIGLFVHDSLHTYEHMTMEFESVWPHLASGGALIADDIEGNQAFQEFSSRPDIAIQTVIREEKKYSLAGVAIKQRVNDGASRSAQFIKKGVAVSGGSS
jgi:predicted O-methyltransferase YrrM